MADLHDVVAGAVASAVESGDINIPAEESSDGTDPAVDAGGGDSGGDTGAVAAVSPTGGDAAKAAPVKDPATVAEADELDKELAAHGIKPLEKNGRENRIPYKNVKRIVDNARKKLTEQHTQVLSEHTGRIRTYEGELGAYRQSDELLRRDPDRFMELLSTINPAYKAYRKGEGGGSTGAARPAATESKVGPRPEPDAQFPDGTQGYSPEQHQKLLDWVAAQAEDRAYTRAKKELDERFGPVEADWKQTQMVNRLAPVVEGQMSQMSKMWGKLFDEEVKQGNNSQILRYMKTYGVSLEHATSAVLLPRLQKSQDEMRTSIVAEMNARPAAATSAAASTSVARASDKPRTIADVVRESTRGLK